MKLSPKRVTFCPGCPKKELKLSEPKFTVPAEDKPKDTKTISIIGTKKTTKRTGLF